MKDNQMSRNDRGLQNSQSSCLAKSSGTHDDQLLTVKDVVTLLQLSKTTVYSLASSRQIRSFKIGGNLRFTRQAVTDFINACASQNGVSA